MTAPGRDRPGGPGARKGGPKAARSWFGPKRVGFGWRPQTWQGWLITLSPIAVVVIARSVPQLLS